MKEIRIQDLFNYINPFDLENNPAIVMCSDTKITNGMTIGWAQFGILWRKYSATVYIHKQRFSKQILDKANYFAICFMKKEHQDIVKYFGTVSYRDDDKVAKCGLEVINDNAPYFKESEVVIICKKMGQSDFDKNNVDESVKSWYQKNGVHSQYYGEIIKVLVKD